MTQPLHRPFASVLIANRGEIAVRIVREAKALGLRAIAVYSDADKGALWVEDADAAVRIGAAPPRDSYLNIENILAAAETDGAEAIHPGYGFLAENPDFAQRVIDAGLVWIGPSPDAIRAMGDKGNAKAIARKADVPVIPGYDGDDQSDTRLLAEAKKIGWPVLIKAALGGGGRGQRRVTQEADFADALAAAKREALSAFASDRVILEKALDNVRHIEVQVFGDAHGNIIHLGERDCSIQRRNQKIIEEAPAPGVSEDLRARMGNAAVRLAKAVNYTNAGTVEFLLDRDGKFYFLEMNTRIQVEHPVTEEVTGTNLIQWQFDVAMGRPLLPDLVGQSTPARRNERVVVIGRRISPDHPSQETSKPRHISQNDVTLTGHAIEARLCAEDPAANFAPQAGHVEWIDVGRTTRADSAGEHGAASGHYDSLLAKLIAYGETREAARLKLLHALEEVNVAGIRTNRQFLVDLLKRDAFINAKVDIGWLEREPVYEERNLDTSLAEIAAIYLSYGAGNGWRSTGACRTIIALRERNRAKRFLIQNARTESLHITDAEQISESWVRLTIDNAGSRESAEFYRSGAIVHVLYRGRDALFEDVTYAPADPKGASGVNVIRAPMAGRIVKVAAETGAKVDKSEILVILEAMKMEHELRAAVDGVVQSISVKPGDQVSIRQTLVTLGPSS